MEEDDMTPQVTLHAINGEAGIDTARIMRLTSKCKKRLVNILVDSDSTHNFLDFKVAKYLGLTLLNISPFTIMVADRRKIQTTKTMKEFTWEMQG